MALFLFFVSPSLSDILHFAIEPLFFERREAHRVVYSMWPGSRARDTKIKHKHKVVGFFWGSNWAKFGGVVLCQTGTCHATEHTPDIDRQTSLAKNEDFCFESLNEELGPGTDIATYALLLRRCSKAKALSDGERVHEHLTKRGYGGNRFLNNLLVQMYSKCGSLAYARAVFDNIVHRNLYSWTIMIAGCAQNGHGKEALKLFYQMQAEGFEPDKITFICILDACASLAALEEGQQMHASLSGNGWDSDVIVANTLINMYGKCRRLNDARAVFADMPLCTVVSWSAMMAACAHNGHGKEALEMFGQMQAESFELDKVILICVLNACASVSALVEGRQVHASVVSNGWELDVVVGNTLVNMYGRCGILDDARAVFAKMPLQDVVSWNVMMSACTQNGHGNEALQLFGHIQSEGFEPDKVTSVCLLDASADVTDLGEGREMHVLVAGNGWESDVIVGTALVNLYGKCGSLHDAKDVFTEMPLWNVISWNAMMAAYAKNGHCKEALQLFWDMHAEGLEPDKITSICVLDVCASEVTLEEGRQMHAVVAGNGWDLDVVVGNTLINMYGKCGSLGDARAVFEEMPLLDVVSWNAMMAACAQNGNGKEVLELFGQMQADNFEPSKISFMCLLDACASVAALEEGWDIHATITCNGWEWDTVAGTALVNMYGKCGSLDDARAVFAEMSWRDIVSWNVMVAGYAQTGHSKEALHLFHQMLAEGSKPDGMTFMGVLIACSHTGLVADGRHYFTSMSRDHGITPSLEHYVCMIDLLGRGGLLKEAEDLILSMPFEHVAPAWLNLLSSCRIHSDMERAVRAANFLFDIELKNSSPYALLANMHAIAGRSDDLLKVRESMIELMCQS